MADSEIYKTLEEFRESYNEQANQVSKKFYDRDKSIQVNKNSSPFVAIREGNIANDVLLQAQMIFVNNNLSPETANLDALIRIYGPRCGVAYKSGKYTEQYLVLEVTGAGTIDTDWVVSDGNNQQYVPVEKYVFTDADIGKQKRLFRTTEYGPLTSEVNTITNIMQPVDFIASVNNSSTYSQLGEFTESEQDFRERILNAERNAYTNSTDKLAQELINNGCTEAKIFYNYHDDVYLGVKPHCVGIVVNGGQDEVIANTIASFMINCTCQTGYIYQSPSENQKNFLYQTDYGIMPIKWNVKNNLPTKIYFSLYKTAQQYPDLSRLKTYIVSKIATNGISGTYTTINANQIRTLINDGLEDQGFTDISVEDLALSIDGGTTKLKILTPAKLDDYFFFSEDNIEISEVIETNNYDNGI